MRNIQNFNNDIIQDDNEMITERTVHVIADDDNDTEKTLNVVDDSLNDNERISSVMESNDNDSKNKILKDFHNASTIICQIGSAFVCQEAALTRKRVSQFVQTSNSLSNKRQRLEQQNNVDKKSDETEEIKVIDNQDIHKISLSEQAERMKRMAIKLRHLESLQHSLLHDMKEAINCKNQT